ncbi:MAG: nucleoside-diphosphate kinase [Candidatus Caenarcaniphilales bacterium]|nr:nucleoside-diphosphate kinase [Candidatus Caenarcaniphilales bacterium]
MALEKTFVAIKPDGTSKKIIGKVISRLEDLGFDLLGMKLMKVTRKLAEQHYGEHKGKPFFEDLVAFITSGPIVAMAWEGNNAVEITRKLLGATDPVKAAAGTIRGDYATGIDKNIAHASDSTASAERELGIFFSEGFVK